MKHQGNNLKNSCNHYTLLVGDCLESLRGVPDGAVQTCITSPPYFGLRDYGMAGQLGVEPTPEEFVEALVRVFREVRRVLRADGTVWLNLGDSYASSPKSGGQQSSLMTGGEHKRTPDSRKYKRPEGLKPKDLVGIPWRVAFALQADGWYLRQDIIWHKPNPMPESVRDRCTKAHEYIFLLSKSPRYYFDNEKIKEDAVTVGDTRHLRSDSTSGARMSPSGRMKSGKPQAEKRNKRSVWTVTPKPFKGAHFAAFPPDLIEPCVLASTKIGSLVLDPFGGTGTTAGVAVKNYRRAIVCELNPDYASLVDARVADIAGESAVESMCLI